MHDAQTDAEADAERWRRIECARARNCKLDTLLYVVLEMLHDEGSITIACSQADSEVASAYHKHGTRQQCNMLNAMTWHYLVAYDTLSVHQWNAIQRVTRQHGMPNCVSLEPRVCFH